MADVKEMINEVAEKIKKDPALLKKFKDEPVAAIESVVGIDLPDDKMQPLVAGIKAKLAAGDVSDIASKLGKLF